MYSDIEGNVLDESGNGIKEGFVYFSEVDKQEPSERTYSNAERKVEIVNGKYINYRFPIGRYIRIEVRVFGYEPVSQVVPVDKQIVSPEKTIINFSDENSLKKINIIETNDSISGIWTFSSDSGITNRFAICQQGSDLTASLISSEVDLKSWKPVDDNFYFSGKNNKGKIDINLAFYKYDANFPRGLIIYNYNLLMADKDHLSGEVQYYNEFQIYIGNSAGNKKHQSSTFGLKRIKSGLSIYDSQEKNIIKICD